jgi:hypothetical protein
MEAFDVVTVTQGMDGRLMPPNAVRAGFLMSPLRFKAKQLSVALSSTTAPAPSCCRGL